jgi:hypothetical protein
LNKIQSFTEGEATMKFILLLIAKVTAFLSGADLISHTWVLAAFAVDYVRAIFSESDKAPGGDFRALSHDEFGASEMNIKMAAIKNVAASAVFFGVGFVGSSLHWF